jgi:Kef-type K+ transport system membrane component KefB
MKPARALLPAALLVLAGAQPLWAQAAPIPEQDVARFLLLLAIMLVAGKFAAEVFERAGQPGVIGELVAGVILGGSVLGIIPVAPEDSLTEIIELFAEIGVLVLLFEIGLETDLKAMFRVGRGATSVAAVGVLVPFALGALFWLSPIVPRDLNTSSVFTTALYVGATLTATSVGITARVLTDMRIMSSIEAKLIIGAAVIDDIIGLVLLGIVATLAAGAAVSLLDIGVAFGVAIGFLVLAVAGGFLFAPGCEACSSLRRFRSCS